MGREVAFILCLITTNFVRLTHGRHVLVRGGKVPAPQYRQYQDPYTQAIISAAIRSQAQQLDHGVYQDDGAHGASSSSSSPVHPSQQANHAVTQGSARPPSQGKYKFAAVQAKPLTPIYKPQGNQRAVQPTQHFAQAPASSGPRIPSGYKNEANILFADLPEGGFDPSEYEQGTFYGAAESHGFGYAVDDNDNGNQFTHSGFSEGDTTNGEYRVLLPDGRTQVVTYSSNPESGYMARVTYEGTAKPYVPPNLEQDVTQRRHKS